MLMKRNNSGVLENLEQSTELSNATGLCTWGYEEYTQTCYYMTSTLFRTISTQNTKKNCDLRLNY
jgi:hypothetical protein